MTARLYNSLLVLPRFFPLATDQRLSKPTPICDGLRVITNFLRISRTQRRISVFSTSALLEKEREKAFSSWPKYGLIKNKISVPSMTLALVELELWFMYMKDTSSEESSIQLQCMYIVAAGRRPVVGRLPRGDIRFFFCACAVACLVQFLSFWS